MELVHCEEIAVLERRLRDRLGLAVSAAIVFRHGVDIGLLGSSLEEPEDWVPAEQVIGWQRW